MRGPLLAAALVLAGAVSAGLIATTALPFEGGFRVADLVPADAAIREVRHDHGTIARVVVTAGQQVGAGELIATVDSADIDARIAALQAQLDAAGLQLESLRREAQAFQALLEQRLVARARVAALEQQVADLEREAAGLIERIGEAERGLAHVEIRSPIAGIVRSTAGLVVGRRLTGEEVLAEIAPDPTRRVLEGRLPLDQVRDLKPGSEIRIWTDGGNWIGGTALTARLVWISPVAGPDATGQHPTHVARFELAPADVGPLDHGAGLSSARFRAILLNRNLTIVQQFLEPMRRASARFASVISKTGA